MIGLRGGGTGPGLGCGSLGSIHSKAGQNRIDWTMAETEKLGLENLEIHHPHSLDSRISLPGHNGARTPRS